MIKFVHENPEDFQSIHDINLESFESDNEAILVDKLRSVVKPFISLVAKEKGSVLGHILFTPVTVGNSNITAMGLGPMAVRPERQGQGIGSALINQGLKVCRNRDVKTIFVLGEPDYYMRFGFEPASKKDLYYKSKKFTPYFFVIELLPECLSGISGEVRYHKLFDEV